MTNTTTTPVRNTFTRTSERVTSFVDIGLVDEKGRQIGFAVARWTVTVETAPADRSWYPLAGEYAVGTALFVSNVVPTRDGNAYGACQRDAYSDTAAAREVVIAKKLAAGTKRYAKKVGAAG